MSFAIARSKNGAVDDDAHVVWIECFGAPYRFSVHDPRFFKAPQLAHGLRLQQRAFKILAADVASLEN